MNKTLVKYAPVVGAAGTTAAAALARADAATNISSAVDTNLSSWVPLILTLTFLGIGLGVLFAAIHKIKEGN